VRLRVPSVLDRNNLPFRQPLRLVRQAVGYLGPGFFVTVGFIDPGNWATNVAAGADHGYTLLWVVTLGTLVLILWQHMSAHLGIVTGKCLAEAVPAHMGKPATLIYGSTAMAACAATALAEVLGAALGLNILFGTPMRLAIICAAVFAGALVLMQKYSILEKVIVGFVSAIGLCYLAEMFLIQPDWSAAAVGLVVPRLNSSSILIAMGVLGAVVMPHNMYLHSEVVQNRNWQGKSDTETRRLLRFEFVDTAVAMLAGMAINCAMMIVAAAVFHTHGIHVNSLTQASATLKPLVGDLAALLFGAALLMAGISSLMTASVSGGTVYSGFLGKETDLSSRHFKAGLLLTLLIAAVSALLVPNVFSALIWSQVCLSIQLPLTMLPLFLLTSSRRVMGVYANRVTENTLMVLSGAIIVVLNVLLVLQLFGIRF
jgi:manganese transport protein